MHQGWACADDDVVVQPLGTHVIRTQHDQQALEGLLDGAQPMPSLLWCAVSALWAQMQDTTL